MCGRFVLHTAISRIAKRYWDYRMPLGDMIANYNIAPGVQVHSIRQQENGQPDFILAHWGFKPAWAGESAPVPINARIEQLNRSNYYKEAFKHRRCVIPASGWYEWKKILNGKEPYYITRLNQESDEVLFFAGIYEPTGKGVNICAAVITEPASPQITSLHDRQPVIFDPESLDDWLNPQIQEPAELKGKIKRTDPQTLCFWRVSDHIGSVKNNDSSLIERTDTA